MKSIIAVDPVTEKQKSSERFCKIINMFQKNNVISDSELVSVICSNMYPMPIAWYRKEKANLAKQAHAMVEKNYFGKIDFLGIKVLQSDSSQKEDLVNHVAKYGKRKKQDLLVLSSSDKTGLPHWILGSFSETAALVAKIPVLVVKPHLSPSELSREVRVVLAIDTACAPTSKDISWISKMVKTSQAELDLVFVESKPNPILKFTEAQGVSPKIVLQNLKKYFQKQGIKANIVHLKEGINIAHTLSEFADKRKAWVVITVSSKRSWARKLLLGSTARKLLALTKRPFLSLRIE